MNLSQLRKQFVEKSGRYDLINLDGSDNGADFFIKSGQRFLDQRANIREAYSGVAILELPAGDKYVNLSNCWAISSVSVLLTNSDRWYPLERLHNRGSYRFAFSSSGHPRYYILSTVRYVNDLTDQPASAVNIPSDVITSTAWDGQTLTLEILPMPSHDCVIQVKGNFYSKELSSDDSTSYWSISHPSILLMAAMYKLEVFYRNTEGAQDWLNALQLELTDVEQQEIFQDLFDSDEMGV